MRAPELEPNLGWLNTPEPLRFDGHLAGRVVLLVFLNVERIACEQMLSDIDWFISKYGAAVTVVGVHSARMAGDADPARVTAGLRRLGIRWPVVVDRDFRIWRRYGVERWPSHVLIGTDGEIVGMTAGAGHRTTLDRYLGRLVEPLRAAGAASPAALAGSAMERRALDSPIGVVAQQPRVGRLGVMAIADTANHRVILVDFPDAEGRATLRRVVGRGVMGFDDGAFDTAKFCRPTGLAFDDDAQRLYVADTGGHRVRVVDLGSDSVTTLLGDGTLGQDRAGGRIGTAQAIASPSGVAFDKARRRLHIAMAGLHQVWEVDLRTGVGKANIGSGDEAVADGERQRAGLAQPAGLAIGSDGASLYAVDAQGCAVRRIDIDNRSIDTVIGAAGECRWGKAIGAVRDTRVELPMDVAVWPTKLMSAAGDLLLIADTHNDRILRVDLAAQRCETWGPAEGLGLAGPRGVFVAMPRPGEGRGPVVLIADSNNHRVLRIDGDSGAACEVTIDGLRPPGA